MNGLLIGRFQPFHLGHLEALRFALGRVKMLRVGIGSSDAQPSAENPFSAAEREEMITSSLAESEKKRVTIHRIPDSGSHEAWIQKIDCIVPDFGVVFSNDEMTARLYLRRSVQAVRIPFLNRDELSGTNIRTLIRAGGSWEGLVPEGTRNFLIRAGAKRRLLDL